MYMIAYIACTEIAYIACTDGSETLLLDHEGRLRFRMQAFSFGFDGG